MSLEGKVALVTGGSRGIGRAIALALASEGASVAVNYRSNPLSAAEACEMIRARGGRAEAFQANVADDGENHAMVAAIRKQLGPITVLVNSAGITRDRSFQKMTHDLWSEVLAVNLTGQAMVTHEVLPDMFAAGWGRVVFITSIVGQIGNFGQSNYAAAKGGLISLTRTLAREVAKTAAVPDNVLDQVRQMTPVGRLGKPEEVADAVRFLTSPVSAFITGEVLNVNGGMYMG
jgi:NAD(P)-dependent dehydrogenase (short-subunit alcohol dehydrogenase family)